MSCDAILCYGTFGNVDFRSNQSSKLNQSYTHTNTPPTHTPSHIVTFVFIVPYKYPAITTTITQSHTCVLQQNAELAAQRGTDTTLLDLGNNIGMSASVFFFSSCRNKTYHRRINLVSFLLAQL